MSKDLKVLAGELLAQMRNVMIIKTIDNNKDLITCLPDEYERLKALAERMKLDEILGDINTLQECSERFAKSTSKRIELEMCIIKLCGAAQKAGATAQAVSGNAEITVLLNRITQLENALKMVPFCRLNRRSPHQLSRNKLHHQSLLTRISRK